VSALLDRITRKRSLPTIPEDIEPGAPELKRVTAKRLRKVSGERHVPRSILAAPTPHSRKADFEDLLAKEDLLPPPEVEVTKPNLVRHVAEAPQPDVGSDNIDPNHVPILTRADYFTRPSIKDMALMTVEQLLRIDNFQIERQDVGSIQWPGITDVRGLNLDELVSIDHGAVEVYQDDRPPVGNALNKGAVISLRVNRQAASDEEANMLQKRIRHLTEKSGHTFISYDLNTWIFSVRSFDAVANK
jgi:hypothetical protein